MPHAPLTNPVTAQHAAQIAGLTVDLGHVARPGWKDRTIQVVGDVHVGWTPQQRLDDAQEDLIASDGLAAVRVFIGDVTDTVADSTQDTAALTLLNASSPSGWKAVIGNHDRQQSSSPTWETVYGHPRNWYQDIGSDVRVIGVSPDTGGANPITLTSATMTWLDARLAETTRQCLICCHAPLLNTTMGGWFNSSDPFFAAQPDAGIRAILAVRPNARAWIAGHTHTPLESTTLIKNLPIGDGRFITVINVGAVAYTAAVGSGGAPVPPSGALGHPNFSAFVTCYHDTIEVRYRDHLTGEWTTWQENVATTEPRETGVPGSGSTWSFPAPLLHAAPAGSRDSEGTVTPTLVGTVATVAGTYGNAWEIGTGDAVQIPLVATNQRVRGDRGTILVRATAPTGGAGQRRVICEVGDTTTPGLGLFSFYYDSATVNRLVLAIFDGGSQVGQVTLTSPYGETHADLKTYMLRWDGPDLWIAIGSSANMGSNTRSVVLPFAVGTKSIWLGATRGGGQRYLLGTVEDALILDRAITDTEFDTAAALAGPWSWRTL